MKIGVLTYHECPNHGAYLQARSLVRAINDLGVDATILDYRPFRRWIADRLVILKMKGAQRRRFAIQKLRFFEDLLRTELGHGSFSLKKVLKQANVSGIMLGSDEIWNVKNKFAGFNPVYFGHGLDSIPAASYAPSFGSVTTNDRLPKKSISGLRNLRAISVRDRNSREVLDSLGIKDSAYVLDPTLLVPQQGSNACEPPPIVQPYVAIYSTQNESWLNEVLKPFCQKRRYRIESVGYWSPIAHVNRPDLHPNALLSYFSSSRYIFTNTFHGVIFALLSERPFYFISHPDKSQKIRDLVQRFALKEEIDEVLGLPSYQPSQRDFLLDAFNSEREKSSKYLKDALIHLGK